MSKLGFQIDIKAKENTPEFEKEIFSKMGEIAQELTKDFYAKPIISFGFRHSNGWSWKVYRKETLNPRGYCTLHTLRYCKNQSEAQAWKEKYERDYVKAQLNAQGDKNG